MTWNDVFLRWKKKGVDPAYAAHKADQWEKRRNAKIEKLKQEVEALENPTAKGKEE